VLRICVFGAGAVGSHVTARLAAAGNEVSVLARGAQLEALRAGGVTLVSGAERVSARVRASDRPAELGAQDIVLLTVKATALGEAAEGLAPLLGADTAVVFCQNGIPWWYALGLSAARPRPPDLSRLDPGGALARAVAPERVVGGVVYSANEVTAPGVVENHTAGRNMLVIGAADDRASPQVAALRAALDAAQLRSPATGDIRQAVWNKLVLNLASSPLCLLAEDTVAGVGADPALAAQLERIRAEGRAIAAAHGVAVEGAPRRPGGAPSGAAHKPSMLQDFERGRPMEIEAQVMAPLAFARVAGIPVPAFELAAALAAHKAAVRGLYELKP
jgi:2-dehydropantoate 2-reductase